MKKKTVMIIVIIVAALVLGTVTYFALMGRPMDSDDKNSIIVNIEEGSGTSSIAATLSEDELIRSELAFKLQSKIMFRDGKYQAGVYAFSRSMSMSEMQKAMVEGETAGKVFQITEGMSIDKIADRLDSQGICDKEDFYYQVEHGEFDYSFMDSLPEGPTRLEGFLFPNTYEVAVDAGAKEVIDTVLKETERVIEEEGYREKAKDTGYTLYEMITVASIIEREATAAEDKPKVADVIYNRLDQGMHLQMDSIIAYITKEEKIKATYSDIAVESDYNPYTNYGLPPGPICSPGSVSIEAALDPEGTDYLFFVTTPEMDGSLVFSTKYEDFLKDKEAFDKAYEKYLEENPDDM